jgi:hypothetical protein
MTGEHGCSVQNRAKNNLHRKPRRALDHGRSSFCHQSLLRTHRSSLEATCLKSKWPVHVSGLGRQILPYPGPYLLRCGSPPPSTAKTVAQSTEGILRNTCDENAQIYLASSSFCAFASWLFLDLEIGETHIRTPSVNLASEWAQVCGQRKCDVPGKAVSHHGKQLLSHFLPGPLVPKPFLISVGFEAYSDSKKNKYHLFFSLLK